MKLGVQRFRVRQPQVAREDLREDEGNLRIQERSQIETLLDRDLPSTSTPTWSKVKSPLDSNPQAQKSSV